MYSVLQFCLARIRVLRTGCVLFCASFHATVGLRRLRTIMKHDALSSLVLCLLINSLWVARGADAPYLVIGEPIVEVESGYQGPWKNWCQRVFVKNWNTNVLTNNETSRYAAMCQAVGFMISEPSFIALEHAGKRERWNCVYRRLHAGDQSLLVMTLQSPILLRVGGFTSRIGRRHTKRSSPLPLPHTSTV